VESAVPPVTTTCQTVLDRAKSVSPLNSALASDRAEMLSRIRADQQELFTVLAGKSRDRFQTTAALASTGGSSGRVFNLATITALPVERVLQLVLQDGREANQVDVLDIDAELAPRYFVRGQTLIEVSNDWATVAGAVQATLVYVYGMADIDPTGALTQLVSVPDPWIDLLVLPLAMYFFQKDPGREEAEYARLVAMLGSFEQRTGRRGAFLDYLENYGGVESKRFLQPTPPESRKR
jgi:hypothetical protein